MTRAHPTRRPAPRRLAALGAGAAMGISALACIGCAAPAFDLGAPAALQLMAEPGVLDDIASYAVVAVDETAAGVTCAELVDMPAARVLALRGDRIAAMLDPAVARSHVFGKLNPGPTAFLVLGSPVPLAQDAVFPAHFDGHTTVVGCDSVDVVAGERAQIQVMLFEAGYR